MEAPSKRYRRQIQYPEKKADVNVVMERFRPSKLQETVEVPQVQFIDKVVKTSEIMQRQVPKVQKVREDLGEVQISFKVYTDRMKDGRKKQAKTHACNNHDITDSHHIKASTNEAEAQLNRDGCSADTGSFEQR